MSTLQKVILQLESFAKNQKKSHIQGQYSGSSGYIDVGLLIRPTSNTCERIFSESGYILPAHRRCMSPKTFEALLLLKKNKEDWNEFTVAQAMKEDGLSSDIILLYYLFYHDHDNRAAGRVCVRVCI
jgi:hypothetical protein